MQTLPCPSGGRRRLLCRPGRSAHRAPKAPKPSRAATNTQKGYADRATHYLAEVCRLQSLMWEIDAGSHTWPKAPRPSSSPSRYLSLRTVLLLLAEVPGVDDPRLGVRARGASNPLADGLDIVEYYEHVQAKLSTQTLANQTAARKTPGSCSLLEAARYGCAEEPL